MSDALIGVYEVAQMTGATVSTVRWWRSQGTGPIAAKIGRRVMYRRADVEAWIEAKFAIANAAS